MADDKYFSDTKTLLDAVNGIFTRLHRSPAGGVLACAFWGDRYVAGSLGLVEEIRNPRAALDYRDLHLREVWIPKDSVMQLLQELEAGTARVDGKLLGVAKGGGNIRRNLRDTSSGWPEWQIEIRHENAAARSELARELPHDPVVSFGRPPYLNAFHAINEWVFGVVRSWDDTHVKADEFRISVPDTRARFVTSEWAPGRLHLEIERNVSPEDVQVQLRFLGSRATQAAVLPVNESAIDRDVPEDTESVVGFLVHASGDHLATTTVGRWSQPLVNEPDHALSISERAAVEIAAGEGPYVEFKEFVKPKDSKEEEIERTLVAFANTGGGRLYVGVKDDRTLQGGLAAREAGKEPDVDKSVAVLARRIETEIANWIKPEKPRVLVHKVEVSGCPVLAVHVEEGDRIYSTHDETICVRRGSSSAKASVAEIRELFENARRSGRGAALQYRFA